MTNTTGRLNEACQLAQDALILAIAAVDSVLDEDSAAVEYPELVVAFLTFAAAAYRADEEKPTIN
jgi:hypothetical protein